MLTEIKKKEQETEELTKVYNLDIKKLKTDLDNLENQQTVQQMRHKRNEDEQSKEINLLNNRISNLEAENAHKQANLDKKQRLVEELKVNHEEHATELQSTLDNALEQVNSKNSELQKTKAKYDYDLAILNEKAK